MTNYEHTIRQIADVIPLTAVTTPADQSLGQIELRLDVPNNSEGQQLINVARLVCTLCKFSEMGVCTTLNKVQDSKYDLAPGQRRISGKMRRETNPSTPGAFVADYAEDQKRWVAVPTLDDGSHGSILLGTSLCTSTQPKDG